MYRSYTSCLMQSSLYTVIACNFSSGSCQVCLTSVVGSEASSVMRVNFYRRWRGLCWNRSHRAPWSPLAKGPPSPLVLPWPPFSSNNTRSLIFTRGIFKLFLSFKLVILGILPILIIQFSIFIFPVKQGRDPTLGWKDLCSDEKSFITHNWKRIFSRRINKLYLIIVVEIKKFFWILFAIFFFFIRIPLKMSIQIFVNFFMTLNSIRTSKKHENIYKFFVIVLFFWNI